MPPGPACVLETLRANGHEAMLVGGCVRDMLLGRPPKDYDLATDATPDRVEELFAKTVSIGKAFGIVVVVPEEGEPVEVATYRTDEEYGDGRRPEGVRFADAREDALRRDFTVNALFMDPATGEIRDYVGGREDLEAGIVRAIGEPARRFGEDHLRMLRAIRFAATLGFEIEPGTLAAIRELAPLIGRISAERIRDELVRTLTEAKRAGEALRRLEETGLLKEILPEVAAMVGVEQPPEFHPEGDVFTHTCLMLDAMGPGRSARLALAVLLHDVGKPPTAQLAEMPDGTKRWRFENHASVGAEMARGIMERLRMPAATVEEVSAIVGNHMRMADAPKMRTPKLRRLLGAPTFEDDLELHRLDCESSHAQLDVYEFLAAERDKYGAEPALPKALVGGRDLIALGFEPGPRFKTILGELYDAQLEKGAGREELLAKAEEIRRGGEPSP